MGTRSTIALEFADGTVEQIYCHWDGYLAHNGQILQAHYTDPFKLQELIAGGGISSLRPNIGEKHPFSPTFNEQDPVKAARIDAEYEAAREAGWTTFYHRDRGEDLDKHRYMNTDEYFDLAQQEEYDYILRPIKGQATWFVRCDATVGFWVTLDQALAMEKDEEDEE